MKKIIIASAVFAQTVFSASAQSLSFLNIPSDSKSLALAGTGVSRVGEAWSFSNNIAGMSLYDGIGSAGFNYGIWAPSLGKNTQIGAEAMVKINNFGIGLSYKGFNEPAYDITDENGVVKGSYSPKESAIGVGLSYSIFEGFSVGASFKSISSKLAESSVGKTIGVDIGIMYNVNNFSAGVSLNNIATKVDYGSGTFTSPVLVKAGASYSLLQKTLTFSAEGDVLLKYGFMFGLAAEYTPIKWVTARVGYHYGQADKNIPSFLSVGLGVNVFGARLNAAYVIASKALGGSMQFSLTYNF